jgi:hypothetical protein
MLEESMLESLELNVHRYGLINVGLFGRKVGRNEAQHAKNVCVFLLGEG